MSPRPRPTPRPPHHPDDALRGGHRLTPGASPRPPPPTATRSRRRCSSCSSSIPTTPAPRPRGPRPPPSPERPTPSSDQAFNQTLELRDQCGTGHRHRRGRIGLHAGEPEWDHRRPGHSGDSGCRAAKVRFGWKPDLCPDPRGGELRARAVAGSELVSGQVAVAGSVTGALDPSDPGNGANVEDSFVTLYDTKGNEQWTTLGPTTGSNTQANSVAFGADGSVYVAGQTSFTTDASTAQQIAKGLRRRLFHNRKIIVQRQHRRRQCDRFGD